MIQLPPRAWAAAATVAAIAIAGSAGIASAGVQTLVGVDRVTFAWQPAAGNPSLYYVRRTLNGSPLQTYSITSTNSVTIPVAPGDQMQISVNAGGYSSTGAFVLGPASPLSDLVSVLPAPQFGRTGRWLLWCKSCPALESRSIGDASVVMGTATGLAAPWVVLGRATLGGVETIVWHNPSTGSLRLWDWRTFAPLAVSATSAGTALRGVGAADLDNDGIEEYLIQRTDTLTVSAWALTASGFRQVAQLSGPTGATLAAARDFNGDGRVELLWHHPTTGIIDLARFLSIPILGTGGTIASITAPLLTRVASGLSSSALVASTGDYDADGSPDVLLRYSSGALAILYLRNGALDDLVWLPSAADDVNRDVVASRAMNARAGAEIALQHRSTGEISIVDPLVTSGAARTVVLSAGSKWEVMGVGS